MVQSVKKCNDKFKNHNVEPRNCLYNKNAKYLVIQFQNVVSCLALHDSKTQLHPQVHLPEKMMYSTYLIYWMKL